MSFVGHRLQPAYGDRLVESTAGRSVLLAFGAARCPSWHWLESQLTTWHSDHSAHCQLFHVDLEANDTLAWDFGVHALALLHFQDSRLESACDTPLAEDALDAFLARVAQSSNRN